MFYVLRVNNALAQLHIDPRLINSEYRQLMQAAGAGTGASPQEVAVFIASQLPLALQMSLNLAPVRVWIRKRKLDPKVPEMRQALFDLGLDELAY